MNERLNFNIKKLKGFFIFLSGLLLITGCRTSSASSDTQNFRELQEMLNSREFTIKFQWAQPQRGGMIDLTANPNEFTMNDDMVDIFLPYFGVRHRGGAYNQNKGGISYKGRISDLQITEDPSRKSTLLKFSAKEDTEFLEFILTMYDNGTAHLNVSSSERENIVYSGGNIRSTRGAAKE